MCAVWVWPENSHISWGSEGRGLVPHFWYSRRTVSANWDNRMAQNTHYVTSFSFPTGKSLVLSLSTSSLPNDSPVRSTLGLASHTHRNTTTKSLFFLFFNRVFRIQLWWSTVSTTLTREDLSLIILATPQQRPYQIQNTPTLILMTHDNALESNL